VPKQERSRRLPATQAEYQEFAQQFIDAVLDPVRPWLVECVLKREFPPVPNEEHIASGQFAIKVYEAIYFDKLGPWWLYEAIHLREREKLVRWAKREAMDRKLTRDEIKRQLDLTKSETLKRSLKGFRATFRFRRGPTPQIHRDDYAILLATAEFLRPAILKLLAELDSTTRTLPEILTYLQKDHPEACKFLIRHETTFERCLTDQKLLARAHRLAARSRLLAYAMAGCEYRLAFSTSIERVREAKRTLKHHS
jgi:hypothetical protein